MKVFDDFLVNKLIAGDSDMTRVLRFKTEYLPEDGCDSEEEE